MPQNSSTNVEPDGERWYGGPEDSLMRQVMNVIPGLRLFVREFRRATDDRRPRA
jgi:hypothetical protein